MKLSIIVINYNTGEMLKICIESILNSDFKDYEILLTDNASKDTSLKIIKQFKSKKIKTKINKTNLGLTRSLNESIKRAKGEYILLLHPDVVLFKETISKTLNFLERNNLKAGTCKLIYPNNKIFYNVHRFPTLSALVFEQFPGFLKLPGLYMRDFNYSKPKRVDIIASAFFLFKKEVINKVGLFDEDFAQWTTEWDYCYRLNKLNIKRVFFPGAKAIHYEKMSFMHPSQKKTSTIEYKQDGYKVADKLLYAKLMFYKKHYPRKLFYFKFLSIFFLHLKIIEYSKDKNRVKHYRKAIKTIKDNTPIQ